jgi:hypothetical protein
LENTMAALLGQPLKPHVPQSIFLSIISTGSGYAVAARGTDFCQEGRWVWKWKDRIDRYVVALTDSRVVDDPPPNARVFLFFEQITLYTERGWQSIQAKSR